jgi:hypothetical protein
MLTVFTEGGEKAKEKTDQTKEGKGKPQFGNRQNNNRDRTSFGDRPKQEKGKGKNRQKGKGRGMNKGGDRSNKTCSYCSIPGHNARDCRRRQRDEKGKQE